MKGIFFPETLVMNTFEITQSLNWYKSNVMTMDKRGDLMAYGSRSIIVLARGLNGNSIYDLKFNRLRLNTKMGCGRIGAISFSNKTDSHEDAFYLASIDEVNIYIWKVNNMVCEHIHSFGVSYITMILTCTIHIYLIFYYTYIYNLFSFHLKLFYKLYFVMQYQFYKCTSTFMYLLILV